MTACGLDFGTSNSALGVVRNALPVLAPLEDGETLIPSAIFFDFESRGSILYGREAIAAYVGQTEGRLMRALKSVLGSALMGEKTSVGSRRIALTEVVELFIRHMKLCAEQFVETEISCVVHGRPVHFVDGDEAADRRAQSALEEIARRCGFSEISFVYEPIAAAFHYESTAGAEETVLVADIGGGTSDFTVIRIGPGRRDRPDRRDDVLASAGIRIGGTDFDRYLSIDAVMPALGLGTQLIAKDLPMPRAVYYELATWATINHLYNHRTERETAALVADSREPEKTRRLLAAIRNRHGHRIAIGVEAAKICLGEHEWTAIALDFIEPGLLASATRRGFELAIAERTERLRTVALRCVSDAGLRPVDIDTVFLTGGSSRVPAVRAALAAAAPDAKFATGSDLLSVALGLTREAQRRYGT